MDATDGVNSWTLEFGIGSDPGNWTPIAEGNQGVRDHSFINWDMSNIPNKPITLHLHAEGKDGFADRYYHLTVALPTAAPTETPVPTSTPEPPTDTPSGPTDTPTPGGG